MSRGTRLAVLATMAALLGLASVGGGVWGLYSQSGGSSGNELVAAADWTAPTVSTSVIGKSQGGVPGYIHQGGAYNAYANVADGGNPASGIAKVTGNLGTTTTGQTVAALSSGTFA